MDAIRHEQIAQYAEKSQNIDTRVGPILRHWGTWKSPECRSRASPIYFPVLTSRKELPEQIRRFGFVRFAVSLTALIYVLQRGRYGLDRGEPGRIPLS